MVKQPHSGMRRVRFVQPCRLVLRDGRVFEGITCNLSIMGIYLALDPLLSVGEEVQVVLSPAPGEPPIEASARVTWRNEREVTWRNEQEQPPKAYGLPQGCGLRFASLTPQNRQRIESLVAQATS